MSLPAQFWEQLPGKTDAELYDMLAHEEDYFPEALAAAREELRQRNSVPGKLGQIQAEVQSQDAEKKAKAQERLSGSMRSLVIVLAVACLVAAVLLACYYKGAGYHRKAKDCWITLGVMFGAIAVLITLLVLVRAVTGQEYAR